MSEKVTGKKFDGDKPNLALIPKEAMWMMGQAFAYGAKKYGEENHKSGLSIKRQLAAALRHIYQFLDGEDFDSESGLNHLGHALASVAMATYTYENNEEFDDRYRESKKAVINFESDLKGPCWYYSKITTIADKPRVEFKWDGLGYLLIYFSDGEISLEKVKAVTPEQDNYVNLPPGKYSIRGTSMQDFSIVPINEFTEHYYEF